MIERKDLTGRMVYCEYGTYGKEKSMKQERIIPYDKAIRDKIPEIIKATGKTPVVETVDPEVFARYLNEKLEEELNEYRKEGSIEELADLVEVVYGLLHLKGITVQEFEVIRTEKAKKRGGFEKRLVLKKVIE